MYSNCNYTFTFTNNITITIFLLIKIRNKHITISYIVSKIQLTSFKKVISSVQECSCDISHFTKIDCIKNQLCETLR